MEKMLSLNLKSFYTWYIYNILMTNFINPYQTEVLLCLNRFYLLFMVSLPCSLEFTVLHFFLGIKPIRKKYPDYVSVIFRAGTVICNWSGIIWGTLANMSYPLIVHFPLVLFLSVHYKYPLISSAVSVFSAYLCCQISNWTGLFALAITGLQWCYYSVRILTTTLTFCPSLSICYFDLQKTIFTKNARELSIIGFLPFVYYVFWLCFHQNFSTLLLFRK